jgi:hypothetical protein
LCLLDVAWLSSVVKDDVFQADEECLTHSAQPEAAAFDSEAFFCLSGHPSRFAPPFLYTKVDTG